MRSLRLLKWLALGGMAGTLAFIPIAFLIGETTIGYSHIAQGISALSESGAPHPWSQTANFIVVGILIIGLAISLHKWVDRGEGSSLGPVFIGLFGFLALFLNGLFPEDPVGEPQTTNGVIHSTSAGLGFIFVITAMFVLPKRFRSSKNWQRLATPSLIFGAASIIFMVVYLMAQEGAVEAWHPFTGFLQRLMAGTVMLWLFLLAARLYARLQAASQAP
jgi:hypothetical membrane protein